jgi:hypothetical protein
MCPTVNRTGKPRAARTGLGPMPGTLFETNDKCVLWCLSFGMDGPQAEPMTPPPPKVYENSGSPGVRIETGTAWEYPSKQECRERKIILTNEGTAQYRVFWPVWIVIRQSACAGQQWWRATARSRRGRGEGFPRRKIPVAAASCPCQIT